MFTKTTLKICGATMAGTGVVGATSFFVIYDFNGKTNSTQDTSIYVISESTTDGEVTVAPNHEKENRNYKCKIEGSENGIDDDCVIKRLDITQTKYDKKNIQLSALNKVDGASVEAGKLKEANNYFKIKVTSSFYDELLKAENKDKKIEVLLTTDDSGSKKFGSLKPLFRSKDNKVNAKVSYSVGKITNFLSNDEIINDSNPITITNSSNKCQFTTEAGDGVSCEIYDFVASPTGTHASFDSLTYQKGESNLTSITKDRYYIFKFSASGSEKDVSLFSKTPKVKVVVTSSTAVNGKTINNLEIQNLVPSIIVDESSEKFAFLLGDIN